ncbi:MAG: UDP-4-amino-4,6-dideoxy-N-acetyl-beta-L-altrosamine transaminase [Verrucomicrobiota bacterium]
MDQPFLPYGKQTIDQEDIDAVCASLTADFLTCGPKVEEFEQAFAQLVEAKHAVAVCNATAALHLAMLVAGVSNRDRVVTSPNTFLSSANCAAFVGATPDFCDIDSSSYTICPESLAREWKKDTKAVIPVAYAGQSADMPSIAKVARERGAVVIEDACHGTGGGFVIDENQYKLGGHPWADMTTFSFHPVKSLTTGEGGMIVTDNEEYAQKARLLRTHGVVRDPISFEGLGYDNETGPWYYEMQELGYNYRITDIQCALGLSQLRKLPDFIKRRREIVSQYNEAFSDLAWLTTPKLLRTSDKDTISWHLYSAQIDFNALGKSRTEVMQILRSKGIGSQVLYIPVHLQPHYRQQYGYLPGKCPVAEAYYERALSLPLYPTLKYDEVERVIHAVRELAYN